MLRIQSTYRPAAVRIPPSERGPRSVPMPPIRLCTFRASDPALDLVHTLRQRHFFGDVKGSPSVGPPRVDQSEVGT
jgi:hypothetical protein